MADFLSRCFGLGDVRCAVVSLGGDAMDCNQVFMILTRGPFPTGEPWDEEVESHLETCADCWRLAEALRPALEVFQEAVPPAESRELPGYWGDARPGRSIASEMQKSAPRVAMLSSVRRITRAYESYHHYPNATRLPTNTTLRMATLVFASALMAATMAIVVMRWLL